MARSKSKKKRKKQRGRSAKAQAPEHKSAAKRKEKTPARSEKKKQRPPEKKAPAPAPGPVETSRRDLILWLVGLAVVSLFFLVLKMFTMYGYTGDEYIYLYQAKLVSEGFAPYSDFAMAHPPLQTLFTALLLKIFGYHFLLGRFLPVLFCLAGGLTLAVLVRRRIDGIASVAAAALFILSYEPLRASSHYTGVNMTVALLLGAVLANFSGRMKISAALCVAAVLTRLYAIPGVLFLTVFTLLADRRNGLRLIVWGGAIGAAAIIALGIWAGFGDMIHNMVVYHAQKTPMSPDRLVDMKNNMLFHNAPIVLLFLLSCIAAVGAVASSFNATDTKIAPFSRLSVAVRDRKIATVLFSIGMALFFLMVLQSLNRVWMYYYIPPVPFAALAGGWLISIWVRGSMALITAKRRHRAPPFSKGQAVASAALFAICAVGWVLGPALERNLNYYDREMKKPPEKRVHGYHWNPGLLPEGINALVRATLWHDERVIGHPYSSFNYYLWHESRFFDIIDKVVEKIEENTTTSGEIFGDSGTVPLFALLSGRRIAANEVDTNIQRYRSGNADPVELIKRIDTPKTEMIILRNRFGVALVPEVRQLVREKYKRIGSLKTQTGSLFHLYVRRSADQRRAS